MNKLLRILAMLGLPILALAQQNTFTTTTLSSAVTVTAGQPQQEYIQVASVTGINAPQLNNGPFGGSQSTQGSALYIDGDLMAVLAVNSTSKTVFVQCGVSGTTCQSHANNALVWIASDPSWYSNAPVGTAPKGACVVGNMYAQPRIHVLDGTIWNCDSGSLWGFAGFTPDAYGAPAARTTVSDAAYTAKVWDNLIAYTALTATRAVTLPAANSMPGKVYTIVDESGAAGTDNITIAGAGNHCTSVTANYGQTQCRSNGTAWFTY